MNRLRRRALWFVPAVAVIFATTSCGSDDPTGNGNGNGNGNGGGSITEPANLQTFLNQKFITGAGAVVDGFERLLTAINGGPSDGVTITPLGPNSFAADVLVDLDGDGTRESTLSGNASGEIQTGASISVSSVTDPNAPSLAAGAFATVTETSPTSVSFDNIGGGASVSEGTESSGVSVLGGSVALDVASGVPNGFIDVSIFASNESTGEFDEITVTTTFENDGSGGWRARFTGEGFDFTVP